MNIEALAHAEIAKFDPGFGFDERQEYNIIAAIRHLHAAHLSEPQLAAIIEIVKDVVRPIEPR